MSEEASAEMPKYQCHKKVHALKIAEIRGDGNYDPAFKGDGYWDLVPEERGYAPIRVSHRDFYLKHNPAVGGYYVVYDDGYKSFSPAKAFEEGYTRI